MPDQFDIQRKLDHRSEDQVDDAMEKLDETREKNRAAHPIPPPAINHPPAARVSPEAGE